MKLAEDRDPDIFAANLNFLELCFKSSADSWITSNDIIPPVM